MNTAFNHKSHWLHVIRHNSSWHVGCNRGRSEFSTYWNCYIFGSRAFAVSEPICGNSLPSALKSSSLQPEQIQDLGYCGDKFVTLTLTKTLHWIILTRYQRVLNSAIKTTVIDEQMQRIIKRANFGLGLVGVELLASVSCSASRHCGLGLTIFFISVEIQCHVVTELCEVKLLCSQSITERVATIILDYNLILLSLVFIFINPISTFTLTMLLLFSILL